MRAADALSGASAKEKRVAITQNEVSSGSIKRVVMFYPSDVGQ
jgi:hypothetical protein